MAEGYQVLEVISQNKRLAFVAVMVGDLSVARAFFIYSVEQTSGALFNYYGRQKVVTFLLCVLH